MKIIVSSAETLGGVCGVNDGRVRTAREQSPGGRVRMHVTPRLCYYEN